MFRNRYSSDKVAEVSYASKNTEITSEATLMIVAAIQGRDCLVQKFRNSSVMLEHPGFRPKVSESNDFYCRVAKLIRFFIPAKVVWLEPRTLSPALTIHRRCAEVLKMRNTSVRSQDMIDSGQITKEIAIEGLFAPRAGQNFRDEQRRRRSQYDRGTRLAEIEDAYDFDHSSFGNETNHLYAPTCMRYRGYPHQLHESR